MQVIDLKTFKQNYTLKFPKSTVSRILSSCPDEIGSPEFLILSAILLRAAELSRSIDE